jgi:biotin operon repressor
MGVEIHLTDSKKPELAERLLSSETKVELLTLFQRNPGLFDSTEGVALRIGKSSESIKGDVEDLIKLGILESRKLGAKEILQLDRRREREVQDVLERHSKK